MPDDMFDEIIGKAKAFAKAKNDMDAQNARIDPILAEFGDGVNATPLSEIFDERMGIIDMPKPDPLAPPNLPIEAQATLAAGLRDFLRLADGELEVRLAPLMREIDEARAAHAEATKDKREEVAAIEARVRAHVLTTKESIVGPYFRCSYVKGATRTTWETDKLEGFASALSDQQKAALLSFRKVTTGDPTTKWTNK